MSDPQNLNQTSPTALNTGAPPSPELPLTPVPPTPSTASGAPAPPTTGGGTLVSPTTTTSNSGPAPTAQFGNAGSGAPAQPAGAAALPGYGNTTTVVINLNGGFQGAIVSDTSKLTAALAAAAPVNGQAIAKSTSQLFITYDNANWTDIS